MGTVAGRRGFSLGVLGALALALGLLSAPADASFKPQRTFPVGEFANSVAVGDLNRDGRPDAVVGNADSQNISVLFGKRKGVFKKARHISLGDNWSSSVAVGRINRDRYPDIAVAHRRTDLSLSEVLVLKMRKRKKGKGVRFQRLGPFLVGMGLSSSPVDVEIADLDRDGRGDVIVADRGLDRVVVLRGRNNGSLRPFMPFPVGDAPQEVEIGRIDNGPRLDLVTANLPADTISVLRGRKGPQLLRPSQSFPATNGPVDVALGNVGGDSRTDIVVNADFDTEIARIINTGAGLLPPDPFGLPREAKQVAIGRVNGDRRPDIVALQQGFPAKVRVIVVRANGTMKLKKKGFPMEIDASNSDLVLADLNRDRNLDIVTADGTRNTLSVLFHR